MLGNRREGNVRRVFCINMALIGVEGIGYRLAARLQRVDDLVRLVGKDARVVGAVGDEQRLRHRIDASDRGAAHQVGRAFLCRRIAYAVDELRALPGPPVGHRRDLADQIARPCQVDPALEGVGRKTKAHQRRIAAIG